MNLETRTDIVKNLQEAEWNIMATKAREYATENGDTLANFKIIAEVLNVAMPLEDSESVLAEALLDIKRELYSLGGWVCHLSKKDRLYMDEFVGGVLGIIDDALEETGSDKWRPQHILAVYWLKHILAMLDNMSRGESLSEGLESRCLDARVYAALGLCLEAED